MADNFLQGLFMSTKPGRNYYASQQALAEMAQKQQQAQLIQSALSSFGLTPSVVSETGQPQATQQGNGVPSALKLLGALAAGGDTGAFKSIIDYQLNGDDRALKKVQLQKAEKDLKAPVANTPLAKINADIEAGVITPEEGQQLINKETALNEGQSNAALYSDRMKESMKSIDKYGAEYGRKISERAKEGTPLIGNYLVSDEYQLLEQAQRDFLNATLRRESGATIQPHEFESGQKQYFPQPGDSDAVIAQKKKNRETAYEGIRRAGGTAAAPSGGQPARKRYNPATGMLE